jgi:hypothetical protein
VLAAALLVGGALAAGPAWAIGRLQGRIVAADSGEPVGFADVVLIPRDTTLKRIGGLSNADGTFLLLAPAGRYAVQVRAMSYAKTNQDDVELRDDELQSLNLALRPEAILQKEIVSGASSRRAGPRRGSAGRTPGRCSTGA